MDNKFKYLQPIKYKSVSWQFFSEFGYYHSFDEQKKQHRVISAIKDKTNKSSMIPRLSVINVVEVYSLDVEELKE